MLLKAEKDGVSPEMIEDLRSKIEEIDIGKSLESSVKSRNIDNLLGSNSSIKEIQNEVIEAGEGFNQESEIPVGSVGIGASAPSFEGLLSISDKESKSAEKAKPDEFKAIQQKVPEELKNQEDKDES